MNFVRAMRLLKFIPEQKMLEFYPPFLFLGVRVLGHDPGNRWIELSLAQRWFATNMHGSIFGGAICAATDPIPALLAQKHFKGTQAWTKKHCVDFKKPSVGTIRFRVEILDADLEAIRTQLEQTRSARHTFHFDLVDSRGKVVAVVENTIFLRRRD